MKPFKMEFSNRVIEHLGIKLYQNKPTNVVAEFLSNSWDADATEVKIDLKGAGTDGTPFVVITDNGRGMDRDELTDEFLIIGRNRRGDPSDKTPRGRLPMGRKGIGKLAGFGIARTVDILSSPNSNVRIGEENNERCYWLRFHLDKLSEVAGDAKAGSYEPEVIADGLNRDEFIALVDQDSNAAVYQNFIANLQKGEGGVCVFLSNTTLRKAMNIDQLLQAMGRRFTVSMLRPDFKVEVNTKKITPELALPPLHDFGYGSWDKPIEEKVTFNGVERNVKFWVKFVNLTGADWSIEQAGIGIYSHGKIAQDRPFFFDIKGKEILSRYIYGVIEADWLDELPQDVISTDRRSIDWDTPDTTPFHTWGAIKVGAWVDKFRQWKAEQPKKEIIEKIRAVSPHSSLTGPEEEALAELLNEVLPSLGNDEEAQNRTTKSFTEAWVHAPTRQLTQKLWEQVFKSIDSDSIAFTQLVESLRKSMVPEAMGLAVTMSQRIAAITVMRRMIDQDKTETHLQRLIEAFPWLLGPQWETLTANQAIRTLVRDKHRPAEYLGEWDDKNKGLDLRPDFVFLSDPGETKEFIVFELKGPEMGKTLQPGEYEQLSNYLRIIRSAYPHSSISVRGVLVGHEKGGFEEFDKKIEVLTWSEVLATARAMHVSYLQALLHASEPNANDIRLLQISNFGGKETLELLEKFMPISDFPPVLMESLASVQLPGTPNKPVAALPPPSSSI